MKKPARLLCLLLAGCIGFGLLAGCSDLNLLPGTESPESQAADGDAQSMVPGTESPASTDEEGPASAGPQPLTEEEQAYWLRQAELLARRLVECSFSQDELGIRREQLDPMVLGRFAFSFSFLNQEPDEAYLLAVAPEFSADGRSCRLPLDRLCGVLRHCFGWSDDEIAKIEFYGYDPVGNCLNIPLEVGHYEYFSVTGMDAAFTEEGTIQLQIALWSGLNWPEPVDHGSYCMTLRLKEEDGQAFLQFESLLAEDPA